MNDNTPPKIPCDGEVFILLSLFLTVVAVLALWITCIFHPELAYYLGERISKALDYLMPFVTPAG